MADAERSVPGGSILRPAPPGYGVVDTGDYNGDGTNDILLQSGGSLIEWTIAGGHYVAGQSLASQAPGTVSPSRGLGAPGCTETNVLNSNQNLSPGCRIVSSDGTYFLTLQATDGNLVLYGPTGAIWSANVSAAARRLSMQDDGNLVEYDVSGAVVWSSGTTGHPDTHLEVGADGVVRLLQGSTQIWRKPDAPTPPPPPPSCATSSQLSSGQTLANGCHLTSPNGAYWLFQASDNLVLYRVDGLVPLWSSERAGDRLEMQSNGNLVEYSGSTPVWISQTSGAGTYLTLDNDGVARVISNGQVAWQRQGDTLFTDQRLLPGDHLDSAGGKCRLEFASEGPRLRRLADDLIIWSLPEPTGSGSALQMQGAGNLVLLNAAGQPVWGRPDDASAFIPGSHLSVQSDGNLVIYGPQGGAPWASNTAVPGQCE